MSKRDRYIYNSQDFINNLKYLYILIVMSVLIIILRLVYLQVVKYQYFLSSAKRNYIRLIDLIPARGYIKTKDGAIYAKNTPTFSVFLLKSKKVKERDIKTLSLILKLKEKYIKSKMHLALYNQSILLKSSISRREVYNLLNSESLKSLINIEVTPKRVYPNNAVEYANIVGYLSEVSKQDFLKNYRYHIDELIGRKGIEKKYNDLLRGEWGYKEIEAKSNGEVVKVLSKIPPKKGKDITLSIDSRLQSYIYNIFKKNNLQGSIIVMKTDGHILGIANSKSFNPNYFINGMSSKVWNMLKKKNKMNLFDMSLQGSYPPGSLIKPFVALSALKEGIIKPDTVVECPYSIQIGKNLYRDWKPGGFGKINLQRAIESSSDVFFYQLGMKLGIDKLRLYLSQFGFGRRPKLFDYCAKGNLPSKIWKYRKLKTSWYVGDTISTSIGQGFFLSTPLQVALAFNMIANNGIGYKPTLINDKQKKVEYVFKSKYYDKIKKALWLVVNGKYGTGARAKIEGLDICGKTGTSQVVSSYFYKSIKKKLKEKKISIKRAKKYFPHAWFASFAPLNNPKVVVVVFVEHGEHSSNAAEIAKHIYQKLQQLKLI